MIFTLNSLIKFLYWEIKMLNLRLQHKNKPFLFLLGDACYHSYTLDNGAKMNITSPGYPNSNYPARASCVYNFKVEDNNQILWVQVYLESNYIGFI